MKLCSTFKIAYVSFKCYIESHTTIEIRIIDVLVNRKVSKLP